MSETLGRSPTFLAKRKMSETLGRSPTFLAKRKMSETLGRSPTFLVKRSVLADVSLKTSEAVASETRQVSSEAENE